MSSGIKSIGIYDNSEFDVITERSIEERLAAVERGLKNIDANHHQDFMVRFAIGDELRALQAVLAKHGNGTFNRVLNQRFGQQRRRTLYYLLKVATKIRVEDRALVAGSFDTKAMYELTAGSAPLGAL